MKSHQRRKNNGGNTNRKHGEQELEAKQVLASNASAKDPTMMVKANKATLANSAMMTSLRTPHQAAHTITAVVWPLDVPHPLEVPVTSLLQTYCDLLRDRIARVGRAAYLPGLAAEDIHVAYQRNRSPKNDEQNSQYAYLSIFEARASKSNG
mmetsp:Transcript_60296/g.166896  ORF Transcript_60296/g.166896 Transcript_60296/m.166896 type:complete len:152 (-) Transcript_60296:274-729(-)